MPFLNAYENIVFALKKHEIDGAKIDSLISMIGLSDFKFAATSQLSGGMSSRISLARVLAYEANLILMDEPFAALDAFTRASMQAEIFKNTSRQNDPFSSLTTSMRRYFWRTRSSCLKKAG